MNTYGYVDANPLYYIDPYGLNPLTWAGRGGWAIGGGITTLIEAGIGLPIGVALYNAFNESADDSSDATDDAEDAPESCPSNDGDNWEKIPRSRPPAYRPKNGKEPVFQGDRAGDRSHGGSKWKKWDKQRDWKQGSPRNGTYDVNGRRLRD